MLARENPGPSLSRIPGTHGTRPGERLGSSCRAGLLSRNRDGLPDHRCGTSRVAYVLWLCVQIFGIQSMLQRCAALQTATQPLRYLQTTRCLISAASPRPPLPR